MRQPASPHSCGRQTGRAALGGLLSAFKAGHGQQYHLAVKNHPEPADSILSSIVEVNDEADVWTPTPPPSPNCFVSLSISWRILKERQHTRDHGPG